MADMTYRNMIRTTHRMIDSYNRWDVDSMISDRATDCITEILPESLSRKPMNNEEYRLYLSIVMPCFKNFTVTVQSEIYDIEAKKAALQVRATAETPVGRYDNEYAMFLTFDHDCNKVSRFGEMVDSKSTEAHFFALRGHLQRHGGDVEAAWANAVSRARL